MYSAKINKLKQVSDIMIAGGGSTTDYWIGKTSTMAWKTREKKKLDQLMRKLYTTKHGDYPSKSKGKSIGQRLIAMDIRKH